MKKLVANILNFINNHETLEKALQTFWQAFVAVFLVGLLPVVDMLFDGQFKEAGLTIIAVAIASIAAGLSAIKTSIKNYIKSKSINSIKAPW